MATGVLMPKVGISVESCILTKWHKKKGDTVKKGDMLFTYETDKSTMDEEAKDDGVLLELFFEEGDDVPVMMNVAAIGKPGESVDELRPPKDSDAPAAAPAAPAPAAPVAPVAAAPAPAAPAPVAPVAVAAPAEVAVIGGASGAVSIVTGELKISPRARSLAAKAGVDPSFAAGTGPEGRIIERDVRALIQSGAGAASPAQAQAAAQAAPAAAAAAGAEYVDERMTNIRRNIAKAMHTSLASMAQLTHNSSFDASDILALRKRFKEADEQMGVGGISLNDIVLFAVSRTLMSHPDLNAHLLPDDIMRRFSDVHLGMAVDTERGLMVPTIRYANKKTLLEISEEAKSLAKQCQAGNINPDLLSGASFTVSNLGAFGVETFTPVINPPQTGILGVNNIVTRVRETKNGLEAYPCMSLSLTYDHRAVDGAPASRFLRDICRNLQSFSLMLAK